MENLKEQLSQTLTNVEQAIEGNYSAFKGKFELDLLVKELQSIQKEVNEIAVQEASDYPEKTFEMDGLKIEKRNGSRRFDFKNCAVWTTKQTELKNIERSLKNAFELYQQGKVVADENGEELEIPKVTYGSDVVIVKEAK